MKGSSRASVLTQFEWIPLGSILRDAGLITDEQLTDVLDEQRGNGRRLGETIVELARRTADNVFIPFTIGGGNANTTTFAGNVLEGTAASGGGTLSLTKANGTLILSGSNNYTGLTQINSGGAVIVNGTTPLANCGSSNSTAWPGTRS